MKFPQLNGLEHAGFAELIFYQLYQIGFQNYNPKPKKGVLVPKPL